MDSWNDARIALSFLGAFMLLSVVSGVWFFLRRHHEPIKSRRPTLVLFHMTFICTATSFRCLLAWSAPDGLTISSNSYANSVSGFKIPCWIALVMPSVFLSFSAVMFLVRTLLVHLDFRISQHSIEIVSSHVTAESRARMIGKSWCLANKNMFSSSFNLLVFSLIILLVTGIIPVLHMLLTYRDAITISDSRVEDCQKALLGATEFTGAVVGFCAFVTAAILVWGHKKKIKERLGIRQEIFVCLLAMTIAFVMLVINAASGNTAPVTFHRIFGFRGFQLFEFVLPALIMVCYSFIVTVKKTYDFTRRPKMLKRAASSNGSSAEILKESFMQLLQSDKGFQLFQDFLKSELSVENLLFWRDVQRFKAMAIEADAIFETYIPFHAPLCINISASVRKELQICFQGDEEHLNLMATVSRADMDLFDEACEGLACCNQTKDFSCFKISSSLSYLLKISCFGGMFRGSRPWRLKLMQFLRRTFHFMHRFVSTFQPA
eukprot:TRINITY_DN12729_c0_g1_i1.p1 TRINITY_DN12729_c0_g1~~TRINITY_DN12729_c0_g1_i1.p1  ORF type:complete len:491 (-),score=87.44 TRINITY_DN12729_c0_g1_i1:370-1842(-)